MRLKAAARPRGTRHIPRPNRENAGTVNKAGAGRYRVSAPATSPRVSPSSLTYCFCVCARCGDLIRLDRSGRQLLADAAADDGVALGGLATDAVGRLVQGLACQC